MTSVFESISLRSPLMKQPRRITFAAMLVLFALPTLAWSQLVSGRLISSITTFERVFDTVGTSKTYVRGFQSVLLDIGQSDFSFHAHAQGAATLQHTLDELPDYRLYYLYARWRNIADAVDVSIGRVPYFVGVGVGTMDGMLTTVRFAENKARFTVYGGANLRNDITIEKWGPFKNNFTVGGQFLTTAIERTRLGISYMNRQRERPGYPTIRPDTLGNGVPFYVDAILAKEQYVSGDAAYEISDMKVYGRYDFNLESEKTQRGQLGVRYNATPDLTLTGDFIHRAPRVLFNSFFAVFNTSSVNEFEAGADYRFCPTIRAFVRGAYVKYTDDKTFRYTVGMAHNYFSASYRGNSGYAGELNALSLQGAYPLFDNMLTPTAGLTLSWYKLNDTAENESATAAVLGAIVRPLRCLSFDVQGQWLHNKIADRDVRLFAKLSYWFSERLTIFD